MDVDLHAPINWNQQTMMRFGSLEIPATELETMEREDLIALFLRNGLSRFAAERVFEVQRGGGNVGRARPHVTSRVSSAGR